jgi:hypothetical protein
MKKIVTAFAVAAMLATAAVATSGTAEARWGGGWHGGWGGGWRGGGWWGPGVGFAAGALVGGAIASSYYNPYGYYPYGYGYGYPPPYYAHPCVWRRVWNGYGWVRACV